MSPDAKPAQLDPIPQLGATELASDAPRSLRVTQALLTIARVLSADTPWPEAMRQVARATAHAFGVDMVGCYVLDDSRTQLVPQAGYRVPRDMLERFLQTPFPIHRFPILQEAWRTGRPVCASDVMTDGRFDPEIAERIHPGAVVFAPTRVRGEIVGGLCLVWWASGRAFDPIEIQLLEGVAAQVGLAIENADLGRQTASKLRELEESHRRFSLLVESSSDAICLLASDATVLYLSPAGSRILGYPVAELIGRRGFDLVHPDDLAQASHLVEAALGAPGDRVRGQFRLQHRDGSHRWMEVVANNLLAEPGVDGIVCNLRDVTERLDLEEHLRQARKMEAIGRLASGVAHDFNNLLTVIIGRVDLLRARRGAEPALVKDLGMVHEAARRAAELTEQLLAFGRKQIRQPRVVPLAPAVRALGGMLGRLIGEHIALQLQLDPDAGSVHMDPGQLDQVLMNLAVNARDAMPRGGRLAIGARPVEIDEEFVRRHPAAHPGPYVVLSVADSGVGMDAQTQARIFEPFFTTKAPGKGTGLGLATVYGIISQSDGFIAVTSRVGGGTRFDIYLPRLGEPGMPAADPAASAPTASGSETILVVEDDAVVRDTVRQMLQLGGYRVLEAENGVQAMEVARRHADPIHLVLSDVVMPEMGGVELGRCLRTVRPDVKVLHMSGYPNGAVDASGTLEIDARFVQKPLERDALLRTVGAVVAGRA